MYNMGNVETLHSNEQTDAECRLSTGKVTHPLPEITVAEYRRETGGATEYKQCK